MENKNKQLDEICEKYSRNQCEGCPFASEVERHWTQEPLNICLKPQVRKNER